MNKIKIHLETHNQFAAFLRSLRKGYRLNKEEMRVEIPVNKCGKFFIHLN